MAYLKGNLHIHTSFSDGHLSPVEMAGIYRDLGFDFIAITDHEYMAKKAYYDLFPLEFEGLTIFEGIELEPIYISYHHTLKIKGETETLYVLCHPDSYRLSIRDVNKRIKLFGEKGPGIIDAVEITDRGFYTPFYDTPEIPLPKFASDDAHDETMCGKTWIEVNVDNDKRGDKDSIIRSIKAGDFQVGLISGRRREKSVGGFGGK